MRGEPFGHLRLVRRDLRRKPRGVRFAQAREQRRRPGQFRFQLRQSLHSARRGRVRCVGDQQRVGVFHPAPQLGMLRHRVVRMMAQLRFHERLCLRRETLRHRTQPEGLEDVGHDPLRLPQGRLERHHPVRAARQRAFHIQRVAQPEQRAQRHRDAVARLQRPRDLQGVAHGVDRAHAKAQLLQCRDDQPREARRARLLEHDQRRVAEIGLEDRRDLPLVALPRVLRNVERAKIVPALAERGEEALVVVRQRLRLPVPRGVAARAADHLVRQGGTRQRAQPRQSGRAAAVHAENEYAGASGHFANRRGLLRGVLDTCAAHASPQRNQLFVSPRVRPR